MAADTRANLKPETRFPGASLTWWLMVTAFGFLGLLLALSAPHIFTRPLQAGDVAQQDIVAVRATTVVDEEKTRLSREKVRASVLPVLKRNRELDKEMLDRLEMCLDLVPGIQEQAGLPLDERLGLSAREQAYIIACDDAAWERIKSGSISPAGIVTPEVESAVIAKLKGKGGKGRAGGAPASLIADLDQARGRYRESKLGNSPQSHELLLISATIRPAEFERTAATLRKATARLLQLGPLFPDTPRGDWEQTIIEFLPDSWNDKLRLTCGQLIATILAPNVVIDTDATMAKTDGELSKLAPITRRIEVGETIVPRGGVISADHLTTLNAAGAAVSGNWPMVISLALSLFAAFGLFGIFLYTYEPKHLFSPASIGLICTVCVVTCGIAAFAGFDYPQFVPVPAAALVLTIFFGSRVAVFATGLLMIFLCVDNLVTTSNLVALGTASCAAFGINIKQRRELMLRGFLIGILQAVGYIGAVIVTQTSPSATLLWRELTLHFLGGLSSCIVAIGSLPFLENLFGMVTPFRLAELTDPQQPLLRRLEENAPGTYQHSLAVANLAEAGARAIGADVNLVRAGALYHDIGKMVRPRYFIENQLGDKNPHDAIAPEESRDRVLAHVTDGLALAHKYDLPKAVQDFVPQHQGTTLMAYFYHKACVRDGADKVDANFFRYPGPRPQSKETAIVMLADVSEAVTHSMKDPTQDEIETAMATVFKARWDDGQFIDTGLTTGEMERVKKAFVRVWRTLHHERLKYPSTTTGRMAVAPEHPEQAPSSD